MGKCTITLENLEEIRYKEYICFHFNYKFNLLKSFSFTIYFSLKAFHFTSKYIYIFIQRQKKINYVNLKCKTKLSEIK